jgi:inorganic phosphate transporter, PiT family
VGVCFAAGAAVGLRRYGGMLDGGLMLVRPLHAVVAEFAAGTSVTVTGLLGAPVSMTQAVAGGLIGSGAQESTRRIRWNRALMIAVAWVVTLPVALGAATAISAVVARVTTTGAAG